jgi:glycogen debranching enzyme
MAPAGWPLWFGGLRGTCMPSRAGIAWRAARRRGYLHGCAACSRCLGFLVTAERTCVQYRFHSELYYSTMLHRKTLVDDACDARGAVQGTPSIAVLWPVVAMLTGPTAC